MLTDYVLAAVALILALGVRANDSRAARLWHWVSL